MARRRLSEESVYTTGPPRGLLDEAEGPQLASSSPNSASIFVPVHSPSRFTCTTDITSVVAGVQPATLVAFNPLRPSSGARTTSTRGKPAANVATSTLPNVTKADFQAYLSEIQPEWSRSQRSRALDTTQASAAANDDANEHAKRLNSSTASILPALNVVPTVFQDENFDLANPHTFEQVTRRSDDAAPNATLGDLASDQILQEKLSHYLDVVEVHLTREISVRSASFFAALANLQSLHAQSSQALDRVSALRKELVDIDHRSAVTGLAAVRAGLKRRRLESVTRGVERLRDLGRAIGQASQLADAGEWEGALGLVEEVEGAMAASSESLPPPGPAPDALGISSGSEEGQPAPLPKLQLHRLKALQHVPARLDGLRLQVAKALEADLLASLSHELEDGVANYARADSAPPAWEASQREKAHERAMNRLRPLIRGLHRCGWASIETAVASWRSALAKDIRVIVRADLPESPADTEEALNGVDGQGGTNKSAALGEALRRLPHADFMKLVRSTCLRLAAAIDIAAMQSSVILALVGDGAQAAHADGRAALALELADTVHGAAELANLRFSKIIGVRNEVHAELDLRDFAELFHEAWAFVVQCETACQRMIVGLRGVLVSQAKAFLQAFHNARVSASAHMVEVEQWTPADVGSATQAVVDDIISGAVRDPSTFMLNDSKVAPAAATKPTTAKHLVIEERNYFAVAACLKALETLADYIRVVLNLPLLATDAMSRIIEFAKQFNSRTCQVVLGAGAMRSAGLKNITAKHLALASQSLSIVIALIPYIREALRRHLSAKQAVMLTEFDKLKRDFQEHQYEIHAKFVAIINDRLLVHCKALREIDWTVDRPAGSSANPYMETLVKETTMLHKVLAKYLHGPTLDQVIGQVLSDVNARLAEEYGKIELRDVAARDRMLVDARYLQTKLAELKGLTRPTPGQELVNLVESKLTTILPPRPPSPPKAPTPPPPAPPPILIPSEPAQGTAPPSTSPASSGPVPTTTEPSASPTITTTPAPSVAPASDLARAPSTTGVKNRLAGLFGKPRAVNTSPAVSTSVSPNPEATTTRSSFESLRSYMPRSPLLGNASSSPKASGSPATTDKEGRDSEEIALVVPDAEVAEAEAALTVPPPTVEEVELVEALKPEQATSIVVVADKEATMDDIAGMPPPTIGNAERVEPLEVDEAAATGAMANAEVAREDVASTLPPKDEEAELVEHLEPDGPASASADAAPADFVDLAAPSIVGASSAGAAVDAAMAHGAPTTSASDVTDVAPAGGDRPYETESASVGQASTEEAIITTVMVHDGAAPDSAASAPANGTGGESDSVEPSPAGAPAPAPTSNDGHDGDTKKAAALPADEPAPASPLSDGSVD